MVKDLKVTGFKVGTQFIITHAPESWASLLNNNNPMHEGIYPYKETIKQIKKDGDYTAMTCGNYGWSLEALLTDDCIQITNNVKLILW